jgi:meso-butanediol dehydrogenase/(S,S)-butanediol dehydrogenase/diacetyl reductase
MTDARVALVTGGASGMGAATAELLLEEGYRVAICSRGAERLEATANRLSTDPDRLIHKAVDVGRRAEVDVFVAEIVDRFGRLDAVVNAHGVYVDAGLVEDLSEDDWMEVLRTNLLGPIHTTTAAIPHLKVTRGSVVNISSINAYGAEPGAAPYGVSKGGLVSFTQQAASELAAYGIRVNGIAPGWVDTPMARPWWEEAGLIGKEIDASMQGRLADAREIATVVSFLLGDGASFITAETVTVDGGHHSLLVSGLRERPASSGPAEPVS